MGSLLFELVGLHLLQAMEPLALVLVLDLALAFGLDLALFGLDPELMCVGCSVPVRLALAGFMEAEDLGFVAVYKYYYVMTQQLRDLQ